MKRRPAALFLTALVAACGAGRSEPAIPDEELLLRIDVPSTDVELGKAFPLTVTRVWNKDLMPEDWSEEILAPLVVRLEEIDRREDERHVEETRRYQAYAFVREELTVPEHLFRARPRDGGEARTCSSKALQLRVKPALPTGASGLPGPPGPPELPGEPLPEPFSWLRWTIGGGTALAVMALLVLFVQRRSHRSEMRAAPSAVSAPAPFDPVERALERLRRLRELDPRTHAELQAYYVELSALAREYLEEVFAVRAPTMTTEELLASPETTRALEASHRAMLKELFLRWDLIKFARHASSELDRERHLTEVERFVREARRRPSSASALELR